MYNLLKETSVRCVWPGAVLPFGENGKFLVNYFKDKYNVDIEYLEETKTLPGNGPEGGRIDQIFNVYNESIGQFERIKDKIGAFYAKEVVKNVKHHLYMESIYLRYFKRAEDELLKAGDISKDVVYPMKKFK